jgi:cytochrome c
MILLLRRLVVRIALRRARTAVRIIFVLTFALGALAACDRSPAPQDAAEGPVPEPPAELADGAASFRAHCALCHGVGARGTDQGPPLVHRIYEPSHHGDISFQIAATRGVRAHHWRFGDMPPVEGITLPEVERITAYVRWLQQQAGIF